MAFLTASKPSVASNRDPEISPIKSRLALGRKALAEAKLFHCRPQAFGRGPTVYGIDLSGVKNGGDAMTAQNARKVSQL
ncbi:hypothetical protein [Caballeronia novacaledonica]|uniref:Uncharacterized protein n=1 Tax=Caballeronia novacaledonica TaxID=1544861 RepID=A0AA37IK22_9BURK|nr:hypothetical protein [Caballeronia novacaledonica]GJH30758.1 hypothetical protein CBA19CS42_39600 [Caballeronia novacaledonica]